MSRVRAAPGAMKATTCLRMLAAAAVLPVLIGPAGLAAEAAPACPNIVILYADDMGYGDLGIQNPESRIPTPRLDRLAREGMRFTDAHSSSGICTPSRYALLTGRHHWRKFHGIVGALGASVIEPERLTLPEMLKAKGYRTACIGKWHLGWDWEALKLPGAEPRTLEEDGRRRTVWGPEAFDWTRPIPDGPLDHGFDHYFGDTVINFPPYAWIEDDRVLTPPDTVLHITATTAEGNWECRPGPAVTGWDFHQVLPTLTRRAAEWVEARRDDAEPFFLYFPLPSPHAPIIPNDAFLGQSQAGGYGDFVVETDWACGQVLDALERSGKADDTIVIFSSDNGPERYAYDRRERFGHWSSGPLRGLKRDIYEGGHRVPFIVRWPGVVDPGKVSEALVSQIDLMATIAAVVGFSLPDDAAEDSHDLLPLLRGETDESPRVTHVHNTNKDHYAIRHGNWLLVDARNGYVSGRNKAWESANGYPADDDAPVELYDLAKDPGQRDNVAAAHQDVVNDLRERLATIRRQGHSAPRLAE